MRSFALWSALLLFPLLTGCGASPDGSKFNPFPKKGSTSSVQQNPVQVGNQPPNRFQQCVTPSIFTADAGFKNAFQGSQACPGLATDNTGTRSNQILLKVSTLVPINTPLCIVPFVYDADLQEICFPVNGQFIATLQTNQYTSIVLVPQAHLQEYLDYVHGLSNLPPSRLLFTL